MTVLDVIDYDLLKLYHYPTSIEFVLVSNTHNFQLTKNLIEPYVRAYGKYDLFVHNRKSDFKIRKNFLENIL